MATVKLLFISTLVFLLMDALWLGFIAKGFYIQQMSSLITVKDGNIQTNLLAALFVYMVLIGGIVIFVQPLAGSKVGWALCLGMIYGLVTYGTYEFTNMAVIKDWSWTLTAVDIAWGMVICGVTSAIGCYFK